MPKHYDTNLPEHMRKLKKPSAVALPRHGSVIEPLPCPFCASDFVMAEGDGLEMDCWMQCRRCGTHGPHVPADQGSDAALKTWNTRHSQNVKCSNHLSE
jgi:hypothetical protein